ncbi:MAG: glycerol kinase GlpK [Xanthomonadaceae bacterium]|nr:glycerol kinase GlpK [Xanthomonadaceae bacterium]
MSRYILALDQGTTSSRSILFDREGRIVAVAQREFAQHYPRPGWVEHDADEIWVSQASTIAEVLARAGVAAREIAAVGITNQRETVVLWDRATGHPVAPAIVWQDRRTAERCDALRTAGHEARVAARTGLLLDPYFSGTKLAWLLDHLPGARERAARGELCFGTVDSWLAWKLSGGQAHVTDASNASRTLLMNLEGGWDPEMLALFDVPAACLPRILPSANRAGLFARIEGHEVPLAGIAGDQQAALFGQTCFRPGMAKNTYGTGCFMLMNTGERPLRSRHRLLTTVAWDLGARSYALEGSVFVGGAVVQWLRDGLGLIERSSDVEALAASVPDSGGVLMVPAFTGLGSPHWDAYARGTVLGITRGTQRGHLARAALEAIAFQSAEVLAAMRADAEQPLIELRVDGGATVNDLLMQFQADLLGVPVVRPRVTETTALGAAYLAGLAIGVWSSIGQLAEGWQAERVFEPSISRDEAGERMRRWSRAVERARGWDEP